MSLSYVTVTGDLLNVFGAAAGAGQPVADWRITFQPSCALNDVADGVFVVPTPIPVQISNGQLSVNLMATDNAALLDGNGLSGNWYYNVRIDLGDQYSATGVFTLPSSPVQANLFTLVNFASSSGTVTLSPEAGYAALTGNNIWPGTNVFSGETTVPTPVNPADASTKDYVDASGSALQSYVNARVFPAYTTKSGAYVAGQTSVVTNASLGNGSLRVAPLPVSDVAFTISTIGAEFTAAGDANSVFRVGVYADDGTGYPGALILDAGSISTGTGNAGTVATGGTPGAYGITLSTPLMLTPGLYWIGGAIQGVTTTQPIMRTGLFGAFPAAASVLSGITGGGLAIGYVQNSVTGALPSMWNTFPSGTAGAAPRIFFKIQ